LNERVAEMMKHMYGDIFYANYVIERTHDFWLSTFKPIYMCIVTLDLFSPSPPLLLHYASSTQYATIVFFGSKKVFI
jgi:hypothetical protein